MKVPTRATNLKTNWWFMIAKIFNPVKLRKFSLTALNKTAAEVMAEIC